GYDVQTSIPAAGVLRVVMVPQDTTHSVSSPQNILWCDFQIAASATTAGVPLQGDDPVGSDGYGGAQNVSVENGVVNVGPCPGCGCS
ncbi:MAG: hypothetical protein ACRD3J_31830, partial [Thermoanaerobaculia bacterium]